MTADQCDNLLDALEAANARADRAEGRELALEAAITIAVSALLTATWNTDLALKQDAWERAVRTLQDALAADARADR